MNKENIRHFGLGGIIKKLESYNKELLLDERARNIWYRVASYRNPEDSKIELNRAMDTYKKVFLDKNHSDLANNYFLVDDPSNTKSINYLKQHTEDIVLSYLFYNTIQRNDEANETKKIKKMINVLSEGHESWKDRKEIRKDSQMASILYITEALHRNFIYFPWGEESAKRKTRKSLHLLIRSIENQSVKDALLKKFADFRASKKSRPEPKPVKVEIRKPLSESPDYKKVLREKNKIYEEFKRLQIPEYEAKRQIINLLPYFSYRNYQERVRKTLRDLYGKKLTNGEIKKISLSMRDIHKDIVIEKAGFIDQLDRSFEKFLHIPDNFRGLNKTITLFMFEKYQKHSNRKIEYLNFIRMPGIKVITETLRKDYLLSKLKKLIEKKNKNPVIFPQDATISNNISLLEKIFSENPRQPFSPKYTDKLEDLFSDEDLSACWIYFSIDNKLKSEKNDLNDMKITKKGADLELDTEIDYLVPRKDINNINNGKIKIPVISQLNDDGRDNYFIYLFSLNRLITIIPIQRVEYR